MVSEPHLLNRLRAVEDPALGVDVVSLGLVTDVHVDDGEATVSVAFDAPRSPAEWTMCDEIRALCRGLGLEPRIYADRGGERPAVSGVRNVLAIVTDEPAAGASLVTANLAAALASIGARVGVLDLGFGRGEPASSHDRRHDPHESWLDAVEAPELSSESIVPLAERGVSVARLGPLCAAIDDAAGNGALELVVPTVLEALEWGRLDYLLVALPPGTDSPTTCVLEELEPTGTVLVASAESDPSRTRALREQLRALETTILGALGTVPAPDAVVADGWRGHELTPGCPALGPVPLDRCPLATAATDEPAHAMRAGDRSPYRELALSITDLVGAANRRAVVERQLA